MGNVQKNAGKGSKPRPLTDYDEYSDRWDTIDWTNNTNGKQNNNTTDRRTKRKAKSTIKCGDARTS